MTGEKDSFDRAGADFLELFPTRKLCLDKFLGASDNVRVTAKVFEGRPRTCLVNKVFGLDILGVVTKKAALDWTLREDRQHALRIVVLNDVPDLDGYTV